MTWRFARARATAVPFELPAIGQGLVNHAWQAAVNHARRRRAA
jgi:hypothetical protein